MALKTEARSQLHQQSLALNHILDLKHRWTRPNSNTTVTGRGEKINSITKLQTNQGFMGTCWTGKQSCGWTGPPNRLVLQRWRDYRLSLPDMLGFISLTNPGLAAVTLRPLKKLKTAAKGKLPWPSPRRETQVKLRGRIQLYSPAHCRRRSALIKASKQHISFRVNEGLWHDCRVFRGVSPGFRCGLRGLERPQVFRVCQRSQDHTGLQDHVLHGEAHRPVDSSQNF